MALTKEQLQTRCLAIILPALTLCTHTLLALSFVLPGSEQYHVFWSLLYNVLAAGASVLGLIGAIKLIPSFVSAYTLVHTTTLSFVTIALVNILLPFDAGFLNPVIPSWNVDQNAICRDIDAGFGWDEEWFEKCSKNFYMVLAVVAWTGLFLMLAQWWALATVRSWGQDLRWLRIRDRTDVEKMGRLDEVYDLMTDEKTRL